MKPRIDPKASRFLYLHGFASSPGSAKAMELQRRLKAHGIDLQVPDLNQGGFTHLTLTRQIEQVSNLVLAASDQRPVVLIGSSLGGVVASWVAENHPQIQSLILLAPAFQFLDHWLPRLGPEQIKQWQINQVMPVFHHGENQYLPLAYSFLTDAQHYCDQHLSRPVPTLILHGSRDEVIPIQASRDYARSRPWVELRELDSNHSLTDVSDLIWKCIAQWCEAGDPQLSFTCPPQSQTWRSTGLDRVDCPLL